jgi:hypothetical protein
MFCLSQSHPFGMSQERKDQGNPTENSHSRTESPVLAVCSPPGRVGAGNSAKLSIGIGGKKSDRKRHRASQI